MNIDSYKKMFLNSIISFSVSSFSFLLVPFSDFRGTNFQKISAYIVSILFWAGFIIGLFVTVRLGRIRKKNFNENRKFPGVIYFFRNKISIKCDIAMIISFILLIIFQKILGAYHIISIVFLSFTIFTVYMHSVFNGNNYLYMTKKGVKK